MSFVEPPKALEMRELSRRSYKEYSVLPSLVLLKDYGPQWEGEGEFLKFASKVPAEHEWFTDPSNVPDMVFYDLARSIGLSERAYLIKEMQSLHGAVRRTGISLQVIAGEVQEMIARRVTPTAILLPIEIFKEVHTRWDPTGRAIRYGPNESLTLGGAEMRLFWSNKFTPFRECFVVSKKFARWIAKPSTDDRLQVIYENDGNRITSILMQTVFRFEPIRPEGVTVIGPSLEGTSGINHQT